ncbi:hypothetical protein GCM10025734_02990 [Kitasatospora paranensis]
MSGRLATRAWGGFRGGTGHDRPAAGRTAAPLRHGDSGAAVAGEVGAEDRPAAGGGQTCAKRTAPASVNA